MSKHLFFIAIIVFPLLILNSCSVAQFVKHYASSGDLKEGDLKGVVYQSDDTSYEIGSLPRDWTRVNIKGGDLAFRNALYNATITVDSTCSPNKSQYSLEVLSESLLIGIQNKEIQATKIMTVDSQPAMYRVYNGEFGGVPIKIVVVVFKKGNCIYDLTYASSAESFSRGKMGFDDFIHRFRVL